MRVVASLPIAPQVGALFSEDSAALQNYGASLLAYVVGLTAFSWLLLTIVSKWHAWW
jgi:hypothetical protein